jgi:deoxyribodipyrimidine photo-lyase
MSSHGLVWFKRDLRTSDHAPLVAAAACDRVSALYVIEPQWLASAECDPQHVAFVLASLHTLRQDLAARGVQLRVHVGDALDVLQQLHQQEGFSQLFSHEETGSGWTYARDLNVARWCRAHAVPWHEFAQTGVVRRLKSRYGWAARWFERMSAPASAAMPQPAGLGRGPRVADPVSTFFTLPTLRDLGLASSRPLPAAGQAAAQATLSDFLHHRGCNYRRDLSSPLTAPQGCSRLSAYLAFGSLSMRQVHQATEARIQALLGTRHPHDRDFAYHLRGFASRLRWHCHFMQKLEDEPQIEFRNFARSADGLREDSFNRTHFEAWQQGQTGFPMVDACMRSLNATGWLNFRMRAMLVSFAAYHLWLHWREPGLHLARQFLDFEPGIHWSQMQMQSGTTGINTLRMYSPSKQAADHDPTGEFVRRWVPELGTAAYPKPIVNERAALAHAKDRLYGLRKTPQARTEAEDIQAQHGSRKSGLPPSANRSPPRKASDKGAGKGTGKGAGKASSQTNPHPAQASLFD